MMQLINKLSQGSSLTKNPLALIEDEKVAHQDKLKRMNEDMEEVFQRKVEEKEERMRRLEREENTRVEQERKAVQDEKVFKYFNFYIL